MTKSDAEVVSRARCSTPPLRGVMLRRTGSAHGSEVRDDPGSAAHRSAKCYALRCARGTRAEIAGSPGYRCAHPGYKAPARYCNIGRCRKLDERAMNRRDFIAVCAGAAVL